MNNEYAALKESDGARILVVDDDSDVFSYLRVKLNNTPYKFEHSLCPEQALELIKSNFEANKSSGFDLILCDLQMPSMNGIEFIKQARRYHDPAIVIMTAYASIEKSVEAMRAGAHDFIVKPLKIPELKVTLERVLHDHKLEGDTTDFNSALLENEFVFSDEKMKAVFQLVRKVSRANVNVLLHGQSGTGKELVARAIHNCSPRSKNPFVAINCTAIPAELLESELFGHAKGSFTGAVSKRIGLVESANGGTLFFDEIGDMPISLQGKLLRFIQEREFKPVGENETKQSDVRILAATHRDLRAESTSGRFREDLYYRLNVICIEIPPLKERVSDIPVLTQHFLKKYSSLNPQVRGVTDAAMKLLSEQEWPGNIRELENALERALVLCSGTMIDVHDIKVDTPTHSEGQSSSEDMFNQGLNLKEIENKYIRYVLQKTAGKKELAANLLGIDRKTLYRKELELNSGTSGNGKSH